MSVATRSLNHATVLRVALGQNKPNASLDATLPACTGLTVIFCTNN